MSKKWTVRGRVYETTRDLCMALASALDTLNFYANEANYEKGLVSAPGPTEDRSGEEWKGERAPASDVQPWGPIPVLEDGGARARQVFDA